MTTAVRETITNKDAVALLRPNPAAKVRRISGVRVYDVGQGDAICVLDQNGNPFLQIDYGGVQGSPFSAPGDAEACMPLSGMPLLLLSHWDKDHWWTAKKNAASETIDWLAPRQTTSPAAVRFSMNQKNIRCIPERLVGRRLVIKCLNGDYVMFEKLAKMPHPQEEWEDCNATGVAFSVVKASSHQVILLPGDAPFHRVPHYDHLRSEDVELRGVVAFHHGSGVGWTRAASTFLSTWNRYAAEVDVVFSYAEGNSYGHPNVANYFSLPANWTATRTPELRDNGQTYKDILF